MFAHDGPRARRDRRLGDVHDRRSAARPRLAAGDLARREGVGGRPMALAGGRRLAGTDELVARYAEVSDPRPVGASTGTRCWPASSSASCSRARTRGPAPVSAQEIGDLPTRRHGATVRSRAGLQSSDEALIHYHLLYVPPYRRGTRLLLRRAHPSRSAVWRRATTSRRPSPEPPDARGTAGPGRR